MGTASISCGKDDEKIVEVPVYTSTCYPNTFQPLGKRVCKETLEGLTHCYRQKKAKGFFGNTGIYTVTVSCDLYNRYKSWVDNGSDWTRRPDIY